MQRQKERKGKTMIKCNNCQVLFTKAKQFDVPDHTGHTDLIIEVCPMCHSNNIEPCKQSLINLVFEQSDIRHLERMKDLFIKVCTEQKQATKDLDLIRHYSAMIQYAEDFHRRVITFEKYAI